jgi:tRNA(Ile)-lysidine synthase
MVSDRSSHRPFERRGTPPPLWLAPLTPGVRLAVAVSGGADSVALLRALAEANARDGLGLVLTVAHLHHGIRGVEADADAAFVESLAASLGLRFDRKDVDTPTYARAESMGIEEAARTLRYAWFAELVSFGAAEAIATAHTLNDQAETVLHKLMRGAWTEGLSGVHPVLALPGGGEIVRPLLGATREQIVTWLNAIGQSWREDATNADLAYTRNRIRHRLLPELATYNPRITHQLAQVAAIARDEEAYWQKEVERLLPGLLLPGRAVRGGGRSSSTHPDERSLAIEVERLRPLDPALVRRLLRGAAKELGVALNFEETARLAALLDQRPNSTARRAQLTGEMRAERTPRELRLVFEGKAGAVAKATGASAKSADAPPAPAGIEIPVPGEGEGFGWRIRCTLATESNEPQPSALLRAWLPGDRVQLRYSRGAPKRIKEVLERLGIPQMERAGWPVLVWQGEIVWMAGAVLEPTPVSVALNLQIVQIPSCVDS